VHFHGKQLISANHLVQAPQLNRPLTSLKGIGSKRAELLAEKGLHTILDLLLFTPIRYEDRSLVVPISETREGVPVLVRGKVVSGREERYFRSGKGLFRITIKDKTSDVDLLWFRYRKAHLKGFAKKDLELTAYGKIQDNRGRRQMLHPDIYPADQDKKKGAPGFYPVYSAIRGLSGKVMRSVIREALDQYQKTLTDGIPGETLLSLGLPGLRESIRHIHFPPRGSSIELLNRFNTRFHQRLTFDRFFNVMLAIAFRKKSRDRRRGPVLSIPEDLIYRVKECFPFTLTGDQSGVIQEIFRDLNGERPMNRLLQGDVGCGKTVVAAAASYATIFNNWQVAIMAPTQVLAKQHFVYFSGLQKKMGFRPVLLTGGIKNSERLEAYEKVKNARHNLIIGTQALIQEGLSFSRLGLVIIDEQHRFGVTQRAMLDEKGENPHLLIMSATPIPRTLSMTVYADLDISSIKEYPEGHQAVKTFIVDKSQKRKVFDTINERMAANEQAIVICPVIEGSEDMDLKNALQMHEKLARLYSPRFHVGLIHGRLSSDEKDRVMEQFRNGRIDLLVGTTVIEVGVHAEGATVMVIEHPERFGLGQLHQLRGRVGRGKKQGLCLLMASKGLQEEAVSRLNILVQSHDGFEIAQKDLEMRGQGKLTGTVQAGAGELDLSEVFREPELLMAAKKEAEKVLDSDPELSLPENRILRQMAESTYTGPTDF